MLTCLSYCQKTFFSENSAIVFTFNLNWSGVGKMFTNTLCKMSNAED